MTFLAVGLAGTELAAGALASGSSNSSVISDVTPGVLGFLVVAALGAALVLLLRSMNKQFRKLGPKPEETDLPAAGEAGPADAGTEGAAAAGTESQDAKRS